MKLKTAAISLTLSAALIGGGIYGAYRYSQSHKTPVQVVSVETVNIGSWFYDDTDSESALEGTVFTRDTQSVDRNTSYTLTKVYVQEGDEVKVGDPLLEYDMTLEELKREREEITKTSYELQLEKTKTALEKFRANPSASTLYDSDDVSADDTLDADDDDSDDTQSALEDDVLLGEDQELLPEETAETTVDEGADQGSGSDDQIDTSGDTQDNTGDDIQDVVSDQEDNDDLGENGNTSADEDTGVVDDEITNDEITNDGTDETEPITGVDITTENDTEIIEDEEAAEELMDGLTVDLDETDAYVYNLTDFRMMANRLDTLYQNDPATLSLQTIEQALEIFRELLAGEPSEKTQTIIHIDEDAFGSERTVRLYRAVRGEDGAIGLLDVLEDMLGDKASVVRQMDSLYKAYLNVLYYRFIYYMEVIDVSLQSAGVTASSMTDEQVRLLSTQITSAVDAWYEFSEEWKALSYLVRVKNPEELSDEYKAAYNIIGYRDLAEDPGYTQEELDEYYKTHYEEQIIRYLGSDQDIHDSKSEILPLLAYRLGRLELVEDPETEMETEEITEWEDDFSDFDFDLDVDDLFTLTQEEIEEQIRSYESSILELELNIRESEIKLNEYDRKLDGRVVKASINGVVKKAGDTTGSSSGGFIVITGAEGIYVTVNVNELKRDTVSIGDFASGTNYETGQSFSGVVTEVSEYPSSSSESSYYYWGSGDNPNASFYPVTVYIEDAEGMTEGSYVTVTIASNSSDSASSGIYLENYFVRSDRQGRSYVYVQGDDGTLEKRYVTTGSGLWGTGVQIKSGLRSSDHIAFPYGKDVVEGAATEIVESLEE